MPDPAGRGDRRRGGPRAPGPRARPTASTATSSTSSSPAATRRLATSTSRRSRRSCRRRRSGLLGLEPYALRILPALTVGAVHRPRRGDRARDGRIAARAGGRGADPRGLGLPRRGPHRRHRHLRPRVLGGGPVARGAPAPAAPTRGCGSRSARWPGSGSSTSTSCCSSSAACSSASSSTGATCCGRAGRGSAPLMALLIWSPNLAWQAANGFPQLEMARSIGGDGLENRVMLIPELLLLAGPLLFPVSILGAVAAPARPGLRPFRALGDGVPGHPRGRPRVRRQELLRRRRRCPVLMAAGAIGVDGWLAGAAGGRRVLGLATARLARPGRAPRRCPVLPAATLRHDARSRTSTRRTPSRSAGPSSSRP